MQSLTKIVASSPDDDSASMIDTGKSDGDGDVSRPSFVR